MLKKAFTLAEVLIVIAIIGVVATLTVPNLTKDYTETQTVTQLRKLKNDFNLANEKAKLKYSKNVTDDTDIMEFMDVTIHGNDVIFPNAEYNTNSWYNKYELKDGTIVSTDGCNYYVAIGGIEGEIIGENIFGFYLYDNNKIEPMGFGNGGDMNCPDRASNGALQYCRGWDNIAFTNWAVSVGNLDYTKCSGLNWNSKRSCK